MKKPTNEAIPLGQPTRPKKQKIIKPSKVVDTPIAPVVDSSSVITPVAMTPPVIQEQKRMDITLNRDTKVRKTSLVVYSNPTAIKGTVRLPKSAFPGGNPDATISLVGNFEAPKPPKSKMTPEERKAARANAPKLTLAEKIAKREKSLAALKAKAAAGTSM